VSKITNNILSALKLWSTAGRYRISVGLGLLGLCIVAYGLLSKTLGLYWDDWPSLWFLHLFGPQIFPQAFAIDRPVQGWLFVLTTSIFGESLFAWQIFGILARWLTGAALGWVLWSLWPRRKPQILAIVILFLVYPGFTQQNIPITYGHQFLILVSFFISLGAMIWAIRKSQLNDRKWYWLLTGFSLAIGLLTMFALEYFFGLELLRPVLLWIVVGETIHLPGQRLVKTIRLWLPYLFMNTFFLVWRLTHSTPRGEVTIFKNLAANPSQALSDLVQKIGVDIYEAAVVAWGRVFSLLNITDVKQSVVLGYAATGMAAAMLVAVLLLIAYASSDTAIKSRLWSDQPGSRRWGVTALLLGVIGLLVGGWPIWATDLRLELSVPWDRFTLPMILGSSLVLVGLFELLIRPRLLKIILISVLAGFAAGFHFQNVFHYRQEWIEQRNFFWQLAWRAPAIEPGTALLTTNMPFYISTDNSLSAGVNWIYAPDWQSRADTLQMPYMIYDINARLGNSLPSLDPDVPLFEEYRVTHFKGNTSKALAFYYHPPRCLKILDLVTDRHYPNKPPYVVLAMPLSRLDLINESSDAGTTMPAFLGPEPMHQWCYYFEKIDLAVQLGQWEKAARLSEQALQVKPKLSEDNAPELIPLIYAFAHSAKFDKATELSRQAATLSKKMHYYTCDTWYYLNQDLQGNPQFDQIYAEMYQEFECDSP